MRALVHLLPAVLCLQPAWLLISNSPAAVAQTAPAVAPSEAPAADTNQNNQPLPRRGALGLSFSGLSKSLAEKHGLGSGEGLVATTPVPGLTAAALGLQAGDVVLRLNGSPVSAATIGKSMRETPAGTKLTFEIVRKGEPLVLSGKLLEKPRDPGTDKYEVIYSHVTNNGQRMRTIITKPKQPGTYPGFMFIQGFSPISYDYTLSTAKGDVSSIDGPLLHAFAEGGFITIRVEKPGVGDSEGGPFEELGYHDEIGIYRETLAQLKATPGVDVDDVFIFGHSMGGSFGPMIAAENPVKGIAVYGVAARTWFEYLLDTMRYQGLVSGATYEMADQSARQGAHLMALVMLDGQAPEAVKASHPDLAPLVDAYFPDGLFSQKSLTFWRELNQINFATYWSDLDCEVLAVKGASDFVVYEVDHKLIAEIVNNKHPGQGQFMIAPDCDHLLHNFATEPESMRNFQRGEFSPSLTKILMDWIAEVRAKG